MNWVDKLERKYGHLAPEGLIRYISALIVFVFILNSSNLLTYQKLALNGHLILSGEVWRIVTFALIPVSTNFLFLIFELSILILCADGLEANWGTFKLGLYYVFGLFFISLASLLSPYIYLPGSYFIYLSLFLGFATLYPDYEILLFLILPVKVKYMAGFSAIMVLYSIFKTPEYGFALLLCLGNYILFFGSSLYYSIIKNKLRRQNIARFESASSQETSYRHKCSVCGKTDQSDPEMQFRYCTCKTCGEKGVAFCMEHLKEHKNNNGTKATN